MLEQAHIELETQVVQRTVELSKAKDALRAEMTERSAEGDRARAETVNTFAAGYNLTYLLQTAESMKVRAIVLKLNEAVVAALNDPEVVRRIRTIGMEPAPMTPEQFSAYVDREIAKADKLQPSGGDKPQ